MIFTSDIVQRIMDMPMLAWLTVGMFAMLLIASWLIYEIKNPVDLPDDFNIDRP